MGYVRKKKIFVLTFEDPDLEGLEVRASSTSLGALLELVSLADIGKGKKFGIEDIEKLDDLFQLFAGCLLSWNLEEEGGAPVPTTVAGLKSQELDFVLDLIMAWMDGVVSTPAPLPPRSNDGDSSEVPPLTMATL